MPDYGYAPVSPYFSTCSHTLLLIYTSLAKCICTHTLISEVNPYLCSSSKVCEMWQREGEVIGSLGISEGRNSYYDLVCSGSHHMKASSVSVQDMHAGTWASWHGHMWCRHCGITGKQIWLSELVITSLFKRLVIHTPSIAHYKMQPCSKASSILSVNCQDTLAKWLSSFVYLNIFLNLSSN